MSFNYGPTYDNRNNVAAGKWRGVGMPFKQGTVSQSYKEGSAKPKGPMKPPKKI